ncbi:MAG: hypothetical protein R2851_19475 [Caldilineaceae bacterium]
MSVTPVSSHEHGPTSGPTSPRALDPHGRGRVHLAVLAGYALLTVVMTWPLARQATTAIPGDSFDGWQNYWNLWWMKLALVDRVQSPLVTDMLYAPTGVSLYFHTLNPFNGLVTMPVQLAAGLIVAYNSVVLLSWVLAGYGVFLLTTWVLAQTERGAGNRFAADAAGFVAGAIFTFAPLHMAHLLGHMQVMSLEWIPFYVLFLLRGMQAAAHGGPWLRTALLAGLFLAFVGLCDWYFVLYLFFFTALTLVWAGVRCLWRWRHSGVGNAVRRLLPVIGAPVVAGAVFVLLLSPMLVPMVREATRFSFMVRPPTDLYVLSASVMDFLVPNRLHTLARPASFAWIGNQIAPVSERTISVGYVALILAVAGAWRGRGRSGLWVLTALFFFLMALGPRVHLGNITWDDIPTDAGAVRSWTLFGVLNATVPFMRISRSVSRYALMVQLALAVLAGMGAYGLFVWLRRSPVWRGVAAGAALVLVLGEYWVAPYPISPPDTPPFYAQLAHEAGAGAVLNLPMNYDRPGYLLYQTVHGRPLTVAYISRDDPRTLTTRVPLLQHLRHLGPDIIDADVGAVGMTVLDDLGVEYVVLDRYKMPDGDERDVTEALAAAVFAGHEPVYGDERLTVYRVQTPAAPVAYPVLGATGWGPLEVEETTRARQIVDREATLELRHLAFDTAPTLCLRYRTLPATEVAVAGVTLPPTTADATAQIVLTEDNLADGRVVLRATQPDAVWVSGVQLTADPATQCFSSTETGTVKR